MKPDWDRLGDEYAGSSSVLIADVDCTADGKSLCEENGVTGYPTIKYYVDGDTEGKAYSEGRDFDSMKNFAEGNLEVKCLIDEPAGEGCTDKQRGYIEKMKAKTAGERMTQLKRLDGMKGNSMKAELKAWLGQRLNILRQMEVKGDEL